MTTIAVRTWTIPGTYWEGLRNHPTTITATAAIEHYGGNSCPHFSVTYNEKLTNPGNRHDPFISGGADHKVIARKFPSLAPYVKWHNYGVGEGPMHYVPNTLYHLKNDHPEYATRTAVWGTLPDDGVIKDATEEILLARLPALNALFESDMRALFGADVIERCTPYIR